MIKYNYNENTGIESYYIIAPKSVIVYSISGPLRTIRITDKNVINAVQAEILQAKLSFKRSIIHDVFVSRAAKGSKDNYRFIMTDQEE